MRLPTHKYCTFIAACLYLATGSCWEGEHFEWPVTEEQTFQAVPEPPPTKCTGEFKPYVVIVAGERHDARWLHQLGESVEFIIYQHEDPEKPHFYSNSGNEAGAYIQYMIDYYDCLPNVTAFVHGHEDEGWHSLNMKHTLLSMQWYKVQGYTDLNRKMEIWKIQMKERPKYPTHTPIATGDEVFSGKYDPHTIIGGNAYDSEKTFHWLQREANVRAYDKFFGRAGLGAMPESIHFVCCSQFAVTREKITSRSREFWIQNIHYMNNNDIQGCHFRSKAFMVGDIWTIYWPLIFGEPAEYKRTIPDEELFHG